MIANYGLTNERYAQMMEHFENNEELVRLMVDEWGIQACNAGYVFVMEPLAPGITAIRVESIESIGAFADDADAAAQAAIDGVRFIPYDEMPAVLPEDMKWYGWVDTPFNRIALSKCAAYVMESKHRAEKAAAIKQDILDEIAQIKQFVDQIERRALKIPAESADPVLINDFYSRILSLKLSATETAIFGII